MRVSVILLVVIGSLCSVSVAQDEQLRISGELRKACSKRGNPKQPPGRVNTSSRLEALRRVMRSETIIRNKAIDAYLITSDDEHQTEYVAEYDKRQKYVSGFSGSSGDAIVTAKKAVLWTDGRYHLQADDQLDCDWLLMREGQSRVPTKAEWLRHEFPEAARIGADPKLVSAAVWNTLASDLTNTSLELVPISVNLVDLIWANHTETIENKSAYVWELQYSGKNLTAKVDEVRRELRLQGADAMVVTSLAEIAWLLNVRGRDIPYNPFVKSYVVLSMDAVRWYVDGSKLTNPVVKHLKAGFGVSRHSVKICNYEDVWTDIPTLAQAWNHVLIPSISIISRGASQAIYSLVSDKKRISKQSPIINLKAKKNPVEIEGMQRAHIRDAAAMCEFLEYFETRFNEGDRWTEMHIAEILNEIRYEQSRSLGNSFETVVAFGPNGAQPHYVPTPSTDSTVFDNGTIVIDSGGQYLDGTTDVTRTLHFGTPTSQEMEAYTRVLMGLIQLSSLVFPANLKMSAADVLVRAPLWEAGMDYMHSTGHGIGSFLEVHEPPIYVHYNSHIRHQHFKQGYFFASEPGFYNEGDFGVRLENVLEVIAISWYKHTSGQPFLGFTDATLVPYEPKLINISLLGVHHRRWLNQYNTRIRTLVGKELKERKKMSAFYWMMEKTKHIPGKGSSFGVEPLHLLALLCYHLVTVFKYNFH